VCVCVCVCVCLCACDVTGHKQKDLVRISGGLDVYLNVFCQVASFMVNKVGGASSMHRSDKVNPQQSNESNTPNRDLSMASKNIK